MCLERANERRKRERVGASFTADTVMLHAKAFLSAGACIFPNSQYQRLNLELIFPPSQIWLMSYLVAR